MSTSYHPETDGQTEVLNRCLEAYLRCFASEQPNKWSTFLSWAEFSYNTGFHTSLGTTPFAAVYGRDPPTISPYTQGDTNNVTLEEQLKQRDAMLVILRQNLLKAQQRMKAAADSKRRDVSFEVDDLVFLKVRPYRQKTLAKKQCEKLSPKFFGPYRIIRKVGKVAYELQLPEGSKIHPVFHVSLLKPARGESITASTAPVPITQDWEINLLPSEVLNSRWISRGGNKSLELLVTWQGRPAEEATWEEYELLQEQFPFFRLADKSSFHGGSIDTKSEVRVYSRRKKSGEHSTTKVSKGLLSLESRFELMGGKPWDPYAVETKWQLEEVGVSSS